MPFDREYETREEYRRRRSWERRIKKKLLRVVTVIVLLLAALIALVLLLLLRGRMAVMNEEYGTTASTSSFAMQFIGERTEAPTPTPEPTPEEVPEEAEPDYGEVPYISTDYMWSANGLMIRLADGATVFEKNSEEKIYPASMTKMMTVLVGLENLENLDDTYMVMANEIDAAYAEDATLAGFSYGEEVSGRDLLYGIMLPSGADASYALADYIAGSEWDFVALMNQKAAELGMNDTNFSNCTGLQDENHYTTCADLAKLMEYALQNEMFRQIFTTRVYTTSKTAEHPMGITISSRLFTFLTQSTLDNGTSIIGGKTGYTDEAGDCLASLARAEDGMEYILITAGAWADSGNPNIDDAVYLYGQLPGTGGNADMIAIGEGY